MAKNFEVGDTVVLKSGGPAMTITSIKPIGRPGEVRTTWFAGKKNESGFFPVEALELDEDGED